MACSGCNKIRRKVAVARWQRIVMDNPSIESVLQGRRDQRAEHLHRMLKVVNALLNTGGGIVCIHARDPYLVGLFDERIDNKLCALIPDHSLFHENFERSFWDEQHILIRVTYRHRPLSTLAVNSKLLRDTGLQDMTCLHALGWVGAVSDEDSAQSAPNANYIEIPTFVKDEPVRVRYGVFQESSSMQVKSIPDDMRNRPLQELINYIWIDMALATYISALSKLPDGGCMYFGVEEEHIKGNKAWKQVPKERVSDVLVTEDPAWSVWEDVHAEYYVVRQGKQPPGSPPTGSSQTEGVRRKWSAVEEDLEANLPIRLRDRRWKIWRENDPRVLYVAKESDVPLVKEVATGRFIAKGITLREGDKGRLRHAIQTKVQNEMMWLSGSGPVENPIHVNFSPVKNREENTDLFVIKIAVSNFHGLSFHDAQGPLSYEFVRGSLEPVKVDVDAWVWQYSGTLSRKIPSFTHN
ncbi:hypothetical protein BaRGS_00036556 [Batillaria attramentaria]|uniref:Schlafen AlbA-2 domain-containing protein n=1 Tax=Batillaria attramentaria TaxID=370345 RepID=A0ABD0JBE3_9CAEN